jgi:serine/threonine protein kinase
MRPSYGDEEAERKNFKFLTSELLTYRHPAIVGQPVVAQLEGFCYEVVADTNELLPVLVFQKAECGDLQLFMRTNHGRNTPLQERIKWCAQLPNHCKCYTKIVSFPRHNLCLYLRFVYPAIIHGDLKLFNIMVFNDTDDPCLKLTDLGFFVISGDDTFLPNSWPWTAPE